MKISEIAENVAQLMKSPPDRDEFIYKFLLAYGTPKATISRLKSGQSNLADEPGDVLLKKKVWFRLIELTTENTETQREASHESHENNASELLAMIEEMKSSKKAKTNDPRFLMVTDFKRLLAVDRKTGDTLDIPFKKLKVHYDFFLPLAGMEKTKLPNENPADVKAAERMAKLFDAIKQDNPDYLRHDAHAMNVFLARLLFCLFAEDTGIFPENAVSNAIASHTAVDGSDLDLFFKLLFDWLDTSDKCRISNSESRISKNEKTTGNTGGKFLRSLCSFAVDFQNLPYVNGGLFKDHYDIPEFSARSRNMMIDAGKLNWSKINPDIFGSMFQAVIDPEERHNLGQHYTSVTNIMKVIEPLFLNDFREELKQAKNLNQKNVRAKALHKLHDRMANVKIFDPACGSGNFLIIAYKELRKLEMELFEALNAFPVSRITVDQFYGIEISDFACETAMLSLWLAEHQMNLEYQKRFKQSLTSLPLKEGAHIVCGNACRIDWETVCSKNKDDEIYILGNPPYLGARQQSKDQKVDMASVFGKMQGVNSLDYIACWFCKAAQYIRGVNAQFAFVSTNSLTQGEQVALLWPNILRTDLEIGFAHHSFKWTNNAKGSAGVICVVVGVRNICSKKKILYKKGIAEAVENINAYLANAGDLYVTSRRTPVSKSNLINYGSFALDDGRYTLMEAEKDELICNNEQIREYIRPFIGARELIQGIKRYCLWLEEADESILEIPSIKSRIEYVENWRLNSAREATRKLASTPHLFAEIRQPKTPYLAFPTVSSERRHYIPIDFCQPEMIASNQIYVVANAETYLFGILSSRIHMTWVQAVAGRLKTDYRYSAAVCYNTFPIPDLTEEQKQTITLHVMNVLDEREKHSEKTMAQLYNPDKMPAGLREAHHQLDFAVDRIYRSKPFASDEERLEHLFKLYEEMTAKERLVSRPNERMLI
ncbi:MAG: DNA methyltransferase [Kiritimatiellales bacterium]